MEHEVKTEQKQEQQIVGGDPIQALAGLEGLMSEKTLAGLQEVVAKKQEATPEKKEEKKEEQKPGNTFDNKIEEKKEEKKEEVKPEEKKEEKKEEKQEEKKNAFGFKVGSKKEEKPAATIENEEQLSAYLKQSFGQEVKGLKDLPKFFEVANKWRADAQKLTEVDKERQNLVDVFEKLDPTLFEAVKANYVGEDWKKVLDSQPKLDFTKSVDKQNQQTLVETYFPGKFKQEDFDAEEKSEALKIALEASTKSYNSDKTNRELRAQDEVKKAQAYQQAMKTSVESSVAHLKSLFPDADEVAVQQTAKNLESGGVKNLFYNNDGTVKQDAAEKYFWAEHGKELMAQLMIIAENQGETKANEELLERSSEKRDAKKSSGGGDQETGKKVSEFLQNQFGGMVSKNTF